jgi:uncharacterized protein (DUF2235 family)
MAASPEALPFGSARGSTGAQRLRLWERPYNWDGCGAMPKKIVLFSDGTGNSAAKLQKTNVWRLYQALDQSGGDQIALYDDGVGTSSNKYLATLGGAFGWGLKRNVIDLYKFVCRNYQQGDEIYGFGFSRGAFTIRTLVGLIVSEGLVAYRSEEELSRDAAAAYRHYRSKCFPSWSPIVLVLRWLRDKLLWAKNRLKGYQTYDELAEATRRAGRKGIRIRFLGLWDTVEAYGIPIKELKRGIDWVLWPMMFGSLKLSPLVDRACHALSLDDERATFHPLVWDEVAEADNVDAKKVSAGRITQVWFAGAHSNVGGGYPDDQLSLVSLEWIMAEARANGLILDPDAVKQVSAAKSPFGKLYNSRAGLAAYYRYSPRRVPIPVHKGTEIRPIVHGAVVIRMADGSDAYAPISLPRKFWVLGFDGKIIPMEGFDDRLQLDMTKRRAASAAIVGYQVGSRKRTADLKAVVQKFKSPAQDVVSLVWDTVWWRRVCYFITVLLTASVVLYPWLGGLYADAARGLIASVPLVGESLSADYDHLLSQIDKGSRGFVSEAVDAASGFLPGFAKPWADAFREHPVELASVVLAILLSLYTSKWLETRIRDRARLAWHDEHRADYVAWLRGNQSGWRMGMVAGLLVALALLGIAVWRHWALPTQIELVLAAGVVGLLLLWRVMEMARFGKPGSQTGPVAIPNTFGLSLARRLRKNTTFLTLYRWVFQNAVPIGFAICVLLAVAFLANRILFDAASAAGLYCTSSVDGPAEQLTSGSKEARGKFDTKAVCWPTGVSLQKGQRYRITIISDSGWFDRTIPTDVGGHPSDSLWSYWGTPLRRWWVRNWFQPVARIGKLGNDEYVLEPTVQLQPHVYCTDPANYGGQVSTTDPRVVSGEGSSQLSGSDCSKLEGTARQQVCACKSCLRQTPKTVPPHGIGSAIDKASVEELARCSPTPSARTKLTADIEARTSGELFIYVNDAVIALPIGLNPFYRNNSGTAEVLVEPLEGQRSSR